MRLNRQSGFTLVEMIVVIVITGIIGGMVAIFIKAPVQGYMDSARRAEMTDIADTALRRMARDVRTAVPNSVRIAGCGATPCVEFLPTKNGGRYRASVPGNILAFGGANNGGGFDIIGMAINFAANDYIVVGSTQSDGNPPYDTTSAGVLRAYTGAVGSQTTVTINNTALPLWAALPSQRFDVVDGAQQAVTYSCESVGTAGGEGTGTLKRYWNYGFNVAQVAPPLAGGQSAILADRVSTCNIVYDVVNIRNALVAITLGITRGGESVSLYNEIHVQNLP